MLLKIYPENPNERSIQQVVDCLRKGGVIICPTDTVYGFACDIFNPKAIERICRIKGINPKKANFSFICYDLSHLADFARVENSVFKTMKRVLPGAFTFILPAKSSVPDIFQSNKRTVGIRVPDNNIAREIVRLLGNPIMSSTITTQNSETIEYSTDPELIYEKYRHQVDLVIDGGYGDIQFSTVLDCTDQSIEVVRVGKGSLNEI
jgi:tRNA threonylcarbamoyl adenosine modification protein (Sua5/YciO/YrdC/YwlC family)